jgi:hypothetical protein
MDFRGVDKLMGFHSQEYSFREKRRGMNGRISEWGFCDLIEADISIQHIGETDISLVIIVQMF